MIQDEFEAECECGETFLTDNMFPTCPECRACDESVRLSDEAWDDDGMSIYERLTYVLPEEDMEEFSETLDEMGKLHSISSMSDLSAALSDIGDVGFLTPDECVSSDFVSEETSRLLDNREE